MYRIIENCLPKNAFQATQKELFLGIEAMPLKPYGQHTENWAPRVFFPSNQSRPPVSGIKR